MPESKPKTSKYGEPGLRMRCPRKPIFNNIRESGLLLIKNVNPISYNFRSGFTSVIIRVIEPIQNVKNQIKTAPD